MFTNSTFLSWGQKIKCDDFVFQINWINEYHKKVQDIIGPLVSNDPVASAWLKSRTGTINYSLNTRTNKGDNLHITVSTVIVCAILRLIW
jgi:hypothetical protein